LEVISLNMRAPAFYSASDILVAAERSEAALGKSAKSVSKRVFQKLL